MVERNQLQQAIGKAIQDRPPRKFKESVEIAFNLKNVDLTVPKNRVDEEVQLPKGRGKAVKVAIFASGELAVKARGAADLVIQPEGINDLAGDKSKAKKLATEYNFFLAEAPLMVTIGRTLGTVLGPRGKMPKPIPPQADPAGIVGNLRRTVRVRSKDRRTFHAPVGTTDMSVDDLTDNAALVLDRVTKKLEQGTQNLDSVFVKTTMGPAVKVL